MGETTSSSMHWAISPESSSGQRPAGGSLLLQLKARKSLVVKHKNVPLTRIQSTPGRITDLRPELATDFGQENYRKSYSHSNKADRHPTSLPTGHGPRWTFLAPPFWVASHFAKLIHPLRPFAVGSVVNGFELGKMKGYIYKSPIQTEKFILVRIAAMGRLTIWEGGADSRLIEKDFSSEEM